MKPTKNIHLPQDVLPALEWQDDEWVGEATFFKWRSVGLSVAPQEHGKQSAPTKQQQAAYRHLTENTSEVVTALTTKLEKYYKRMRPRYLPFLGSKAARLMPEPAQAQDLLRLIDLVHIYIHAESKNGTAYVGFHFDATWEQEHGLGFIMLLNKVIEVDSADISFSWSAE